MSNNSSAWIISRNDDLTWFTGSALASFAVVGLYFVMVEVMHLSLMLTIAIIYFSWALFIDTSHIFATYTRTYFDKEFRHERRDLLTFSLLALAIGPLLVLFHYYFYGIESTRAFSVVFHRFALCYAFYHLARQHWGLITLYNKKNGQDNTTTRSLDGLLLAFGLAYPFAYVNANEIHNVTVTLADRLPIHSDSWDSVTITLLMFTALVWLISWVMRNFADAERFSDGGRFLFKAGFIPLVAALVINIFISFGVKETLQLLSDSLLTAFIVALILNIGLLVLQIRQGYPIIWAKWLLMATILITNNVILHLSMPILMFVIGITIFHNIQYHRIIRFHNVNKYLKSDTPSRFGFAVKVTSRLEILVVLSLIFGLFFLIPKTSVEFIETELLNYTLSTMLWGIAFHHYLVDARIWKMKSTKNLNADLRVAPQTT